MPQQDSAPRGRAADYDRRRQEPEDQEEELRELRELPRHGRPLGSSPEVDDDDDSGRADASLGAIMLLDDDLPAVVEPVHDDEFACCSCFLVFHRAQLARRDGSMSICCECV